MKQILLSESSLDYRKNAHSVGVSLWHMEWCTKYRYNMMRKIENQKLMGACIRRSASKNGVVIIDIAVEPEHIHVVVELKFSMTSS